MNETKSYDLSIIGSGPGGYVAAVRAAQLGMTVQVIELEPRLGGVCTLRGCIPTKALLHTADVLEEARHGADIGVLAREVRLELAGAQKHKEKLERVAKGVEWDPISNCIPPGYPRWLTEPFLREFVLRPDQTLLINEMVNDIRRIYTDGRAHTPPEEAYALWNGDSVGFWDGDSLVIHTVQLMGGQYQRSQPDYTDQVETVERWRKVDDNTIEATVTIYDPPSLVKPWQVTQRYLRITTPGIRIRSWVCEENANNEVVKTREGATEHVIPGPGAGPIMKNKGDK